MKGYDMKCAMLVYQAGIANVFEVEVIGLTPPARGNTTCLMQGTFSTCRWFALGLKAAGVEVSTAWCNQAGNIIGADWTDDRESQQTIPL